MRRRTARDPYLWVGGITRAEMAGIFRAAATGARRTGNKEQAAALRQQADRAASSVMNRFYQPWPFRPPPRSVWSLYKSKHAIRRQRAWAKRLARAHVRAGRVGDRTILAMTCWKCGKFMQGNSFGRHLRNKKDKVAYLDRRCVNCKWGSRAKRGRDQ